MYFRCFWMMDRSAPNWIHRIISVLHTYFFAPGVEKPVLIQGCNWTWSFIEAAAVRTVWRISGSVWMYIKKGLLRLRLTRLRNNFWACSTVGASVSHSMPRVEPYFPKGGSQITRSVKTQHL